MRDAEEKVFFSEEKKQKTFTSLSRFFPAAYAQYIKVFWFFSSEKNCLLAFYKNRRARVAALVGWVSAA
jgi:hypothetical protein